MRNNPSVNDVLIGSNFNQHVGNNEIKQFYNTTGAYKIYPMINNAQINQIRKTHAHGSNLINSLATTQGIMDCDDGCKLLSNNSIAESDYCSYAIDAAFEDYLIVKCINRIISIRQY